MNGTHAQKGAIEMLEREVRLSHTELTLGIRTERNEGQVAESLSNEHKTGEPWYWGFKVP